MTELGAVKRLLILYASDVKVCALCPGFTYTEFHDVNGTRKMISKLPDYLWLDAKNVVSDAVKSLDRDKPKTVVVPGMQYKAIVFIYRYLPWIASIITKKNAKHYRVTD